MDIWKPLVYVVDDEETIARTLALILNNAGFRALSFADAKQAVAAADSSSSPDVLLSDVVMPGMCGIELAIQFRQSYPQCKVLLFSGQVGISGKLEDARRQGYEFEILQKPIYPADLLAKLREDFPIDSNGQKAVQMPSKLSHRR